MERKLIDFNEAAYSKKVGCLESFKGLIEKAIGIFNSFQIGDFAPEDLEDLIFNTESLVTRKLLARKDITPLLEFGLSKSKVIEMLSRPTNEQALFEPIEQFKRLFPSWIERAHLSIANIKLLLHYYYFDETNKLCIKQDEIDRFHKHEEIYIETEEAKNLFSFATDFLKLCENYNIKISAKSDLNNLMQGLIEMKGEKPGINIPYVQNVEQRARK